MAAEMRRYQETASGICGAAVGLFTSELVSETVAKAAGATKWGKFGIKAVLKAVIGGIFVFVSTKVPGLWAMFSIVAGWAGWGSIFMDFLFAVKAGGLPGIAEYIAVRARKAAIGAKAASSTFQRGATPEMVSQMSVSEGRSGRIGG